MTFKEACKFAQTHKGDLGLLYPEELHPQILEAREMIGSAPCCGAVKIVDAYVCPYGKFPEDCAEYARLVKLEENA